MEKVVVWIALLGLLLTFVNTAPTKGNWDIYSFHINSTVTGRYATTLITSRVVNRMERPEEIEFHVRIPKNAFISNFKMLIDGQIYDGIVKGKQEATQQYTEAVSRGQSAGIVSSVGRTLETFKTSVTVASHQKVTFELTYEELLRRRLGKYELQIYARPMQPVADFKIDVLIEEEAGINFLEVKGGLSTKSLANAVTKTLSTKQAWVYFYPTVAQQKLCDSCGEEGMNGDLVIVYDVNRDNSLGEITEANGYFVHHFAPAHLSRIPKNVVFMIDQSGSMHGRKMHQTREALLHILGDLAEDDYFGLITFNGKVSHWKRELLQANTNNVEAAKVFTESIRDRGSTNINEAVLSGAQMLNQNPRNGLASLLILLTDGDPTTGVTNLEEIQSNVREAINKKFPLYCLGFGHDVNFEFLEKMALENSGVARRIYADSDADQQLKGFYEEVATPLLTDVLMVYAGGNNLTQTKFSQYYNGSEIVVAGQITDNNLEAFIPTVVAISGSTRVEYSKGNGNVLSAEGISESRLSRVWAYLTVKQLLDKELQLRGDEREKVRNETLELSLKYGFVTPHTSMVVTKPEGEDVQVINKPKEKNPGEAGKAGIPVMHYDTPHMYDIAHPGPSFRIPISVPGTRRRDRKRLGSVGGRGVELHDMGSHRNVPRGGGVTEDQLRFHFTDYTASFPQTTKADSPVIIKTTILQAVPKHQMFVLKAENQTLQLCYQLDASLSLKLLQDPDRELSVKGTLDSSTGRGFRKVGIQYKTEVQMEIDTNTITVRHGQTVNNFTWTDELFTLPSVSLRTLPNEADISVGDMRLVVLRHSVNGVKFLWPVLRQIPSGDGVGGLLAIKPITYEETRPSKLNIRGKTVSSSRSSVWDHSVRSSPLLDCWLVPARSALGEDVSSFLAPDP